MGRGQLKRTPGTATRPPGLGNSPFKPAATGCPYDCVRISSSPGSPGCKWFSPEKAQIEFVCSGAAVGDDWPTSTPVAEPGPLISPANAGPAPRAARATADMAAATHIFAGMFSPFRLSVEFAQP